MASSASGQQDNQILRCDWLPDLYLARSGLPAVFRKKDYLESDKEILY